MKPGIIFCLLVVLNIQVFSQDQAMKKYADSVGYIITHTTNDTIKMVSLLGLSDYHIQNKRDSALLLIEQAIGIANTLKQPLWRANALSLKGFILMSQENYPMAIKAVNEAMLIVKDEKNEINAYVPEQSEFPNDPHKFRLYMLMETLHQLGNINSSVGNKDEAIDNFKEEIYISDIMKSKYGRITSNMNIGSIFLGKGMLDSALIYSQRALSNIDIIGYNPDEGIILRNIGNIYFRQGNLDTAMLYYRKSLTSSKIYNNLSGECSANISLAELFQHRSQADSMMYYAKAAFTAATTLNSPTRKNASISLIAAAYKMMGNIDSAFFYMRASKLHGDSLNEDRIRNLTQFQHINFDEQMKLEKIAQEGIAYKNNIRTAGLFTGLGLLSILTIVFYRNNKQKQKANKVLEKTLADLKATQAQLIQSEKMASLGELTAGIAHEIQNPLNFVNNFSEINAELSKEILDAAAKGDIEEVKALAIDIKSNQEKIKEHGKRADSIVKGMLQHSRSSAGSKEPTDLAALADEYLRLAYHGMRARDKAFNASLKTDFEAGTPLVPVVAQDIGRVLLNLFNNAFYAVNERQKTGGDGYEPEVRVGIRADNKGAGPCITIEVSDNGSGIPEAIREKIFQPFFTTKPTGQGTGLGLSLSYDIIKAHGGELKAEAKEGIGSTFRIQLPVSST